MLVQGIIANLGMIVWLLLWWVTLRRKAKSRSHSGSKGFWSTYLDEFNQRKFSTRMVVRFKLALYSATGVALLAVLVPVFWKSWWGVALVALVHIGFAFALPFLVYRRWTLRLIPVGCILWITLPIDLSCAIDAVGMEALAESLETNISALEELKQHLLFWSLGGYGSIAYALARIYKTHIETMNMRENPQPIWLLFLLAGLIGWSALATWSSQLTVETAAVGIVLGSVVSAGLGVVLARYFYRKGLFPCQSKVRTSQQIVQRLSAAVEQSSDPHERLGNLRETWLLENASGHLAHEGVPHPQGLWTQLEHLHTLSQLWEKQTPYDITFFVENCMGPPAAKKRVSGVPEGRSK